MLDRNTLESSPPLMRSSLSYMGVSPPRFRRHHHRPPMTAATTGTPTPTPTPIPTFRPVWEDEPVDLLLLPVTPDAVGVSTGRVVVDSAKVTLVFVRVTMMVVLPPDASTMVDDTTSVVTPVEASEEGPSVVDGDDDASVDDSVGEGEGDSVGVAEVSVDTGTNADEDSEVDTGVEDSVVEDSVVEDSVVEDSVVEDSVVEDSVVEDSVVEDSVVEDSTVEDSGVEDTGVEVSDDEISVDEKKPSEEVEEKGMDEVALFWLLPWLPWNCRFSTTTNGGSVESVIVAGTPSFSIICCTRSATLLEVASVAAEATSASSAVEKTYFAATMFLVMVFGFCGMVSQV